MSGRKRKAEQISADDSANADASLHLPPPVWGHVLDFMPYGEVRSALLVGKLIAVEAVKYVQTLNIMKSSQMHVPSVRRFAKAQEVNILCLLEGSNRIVDEFEVFKISTDVMSRTLPFILSFEKLKSLFVGGRLQTYDDEEGKKSRTTYSNMWCSGPDNHEDLFRGFVASFLGAFKTKAIPEDIQLLGVFDSLQDARPCYIYNRRNLGQMEGVNSKPCKWCQDICAHYEMKDVLLHRNDLCIEDQIIIDLIRKRPGGEKAILAVSGEWLCEWVNRERLVCRYKRIPGAYKEIRNLCRKFNVPGNSLQICHVSEPSFAELKRHLKKGFDPKRIDRDNAIRVLGPHDGREDEEFWEFQIWAKSTIEKLIELGFPLDCDSLPVLDDDLLEFKDED